MSGWKNYLDKCEVSEANAKDRASTCAACPEAKNGKLLAFIKDDLKEIEGTYCKACGCPLSAKVRSHDTCPKNKW